MSASVEVGSIVKIIAPELRFTGKYGQVVEINTDDGNVDGPIGVKFPRYYKYLFDYPLEHDQIVRFQLTDLQRCSNEDFARAGEPTIEQMCDLLFSHNMWHTMYKLRNPLLIGLTECAHEECDRLAAFRILVNCQGVAIQYDVCPKHSHFHGINTDCFPAKKDKPDRNIDTSKLAKLVKGA